MYFLVTGLWLFVALIFEGESSTASKSITVPPIVLTDGHNLELILDCQHELKDDNSFIVIKWFKDNEAVYQWIRGQKPTVFPQFKGQVDEKSTEQTQKYGSLILTTPSINTAGIYKCIALTATDTDTVEKNVQVVDVSNHSLRFFHQKISNETRLVCEVDNVYPSPTIQFSINNNTILPLQSMKINKTKDGLYNASAVAVREDFDESKDEYKCTVTFMDLFFNLSTTISSGKLPISTVSNLILLFMIPFLV